MPETAVHDHSKVGSRRHHVASAPAIHLKQRIDAVAQHTRMEDSAAFDFRPRVAAPIRSHRPEGGNRKRRRIHRPNQTVTVEKSDLNTDFRSGSPSTCLSFTGCTGGFSRCAML